jgi:hypothetical protein
MTKNWYCLAVRCVAVALALPAVALAGDIERIDPPSWWTGFNDTRLQLMVHGEDIAGFDASVEYPGITVERVVRGDSRNYLFVYLEIGRDAEPGAIKLNFSSDSETLTRDYELQKRARDPEQLPTFSNADAIYLITPDRFANGDPANDTIPGYGDPLAGTAETSRASERTSTTSRGWASRRSGSIPCSRTPCPKPPTTATRRRTTTRSTRALARTPSTSR